MKGPPYTLVQMQDALGRPFFVSRPTPDGHEAHNIYLSLDKNLQYMAQRALESAVDKAQAKGGQCLILNPDTGEILALAVVPSYNPNIFWKYRPYQWRNRTITDCYEPGSTIKVFLLAAALEEGIVSPQSMFYCEQGRFEIANHVIHDTKEYGEMSVSDIVVFSSNIGAVKIGQKLGYENYYEYLEKFGFGKKTEIDLIGERSGFVRSPRNAREIDQATSYFGQGISTTSLQLAVAMAAIANGGKLVRPFVVKKVTDEYGRVVQENQPHVVRRVLSPNTARQVAQILEGVVSEQGTGTLAAIPGYKVAGKTGTSQKVDPHTGRYSATNYVATFVGFMPAGNAKLVMLVTIDEPKGKRYGGLVAGPVFSEVGTYALNHLQINPQIQLVKISEHPEQHEIQPAMSDLEPEVGTADDGVLPDFSGHSMREVLKVGRALGLNVVLEGTGLAFQQTPQPGSYLDNITTVRVNFRPPR